MTKRVILFLILIVPLWAACSQETVETTPTPFDARTTAVSLLASASPTPVTLSELLAAPEMYENQLLQVSGNFAPRPLLVCNGEAHPGPATWALQESTEMVMPAGGFDNQIRSLMKRGDSMTVSGYWRHWQGPVGCGKQAVGRELWYLKVTELVSPQFLALRGAGPAPIATGEEAPPELPDDGTPPIDDSEVTAVPGSPITATVPITNPQLSTPTAPASTLPPGNPPSGQEATATATATPTTPSPGQTITPVPGTSQTPTPATTTNPNTTASPTSTSDGRSTPAGTPTTQAGGTPTQPSGGSFTVIELGDIINPDDGVYGYESLAAWQKHNWTLELDTSTVVKISVVGEPNMNLALTVIDEIDNEIANQNSAPTGQIEAIANLSVNPNETYIVQVYEANGIGGDYFMTIEGNNSTIILSSRGVLRYGETKMDSLPEGDYHFWYFYGQANDVIDIVTSADNNGLLLISLNDSKGEIVQDEFGNYIEYIEEEVTDLRLPASSLYLIWLEEFAYEPTNYSISLVRH